MLSTICTIIAKLWSTIPDNPDTCIHFYHTAFGSNLNIFFGKGFFATEARRHREKYIFLLGFVYLKPKKGLFGLGKEKIVKWVDIYEIEDKDKIKSFYNLYFDKKTDNLKTEFSTLKKFDSMEAFIKWQVKKTISQQAVLFPAMSPEGDVAYDKLPVFITYRQIQKLDGFIKSLKLKNIAAI